MKGISRDVSDLVELALDQGWAVDRLRSGHLRWRPPQGPIVHSQSKATFENRALHNLRAQLKRAGLALEHHGDDTMAVHRPDTVPAEPPACGDGCAHEAGSPEPAVLPSERRRQLIRFGRQCEAVLRHAAAREDLRYLLMCAVECDLTVTDIVEALE